MAPRRERPPAQDPPAPVIEALGEVELPNLEGRAVRVGTLWEERPAALIFLRHYG
ncbi:MAG TPA: hypothetical protein VG245_02675 [Candidatus Dormibacteraeota bacterium]|jgi:hypothetical protein|nr:hypothetical protein [Candidatus Dormibacteraeota bacterium]